MWPWRCLTAVAVSLLLVACGGSASTGSSSRTAGSAAAGTGTSAAGTATSAAGTATSAATPAGGSAGAPASTATSSSPDATTSTTSAPGAPSEVPARRARRAPRPRPGVSSGATLPASFVVLSGGRLTPPVVSAPGATTIALSVADHDRLGHTVVLKAPGSPKLHVAAGHAESAQVHGLADGRYPILVDGRARGALVVGSQGGP
jgi:hypothetical protein